MTRRHVIPLLVSACVTAPLVAEPRRDPELQAAPAQVTAALPKPTGPLSIGTTTFRLVDERRAEPFGDGTERRQIVVHAWYPAVSASSGRRVPYLREGLAEARTFAALLRQPDNALDYLDAMRTYALVDAPPRTGERLPVLLFSHGYAAVASSYAALLEELASHGYAVFSVVHPYEAVAATLGPDRVVTVLDGRKQMRTAIRDLLGEWAKEDETMAAVTKARDEAEALALMRGYLGGLKLTTDALERWVADTALVLEKLPALPGGPAARLAARLDLARVGAVGHSMGGVTAADFCARDRRCRAALNLDGIPQYGSLIDMSVAKPFLMVYSGREGRLGASDVVYQRAFRPYRRVDVAETLHLDFSDMPLWRGPLAARPIFGKRPAEDAVAVTRAIVREWFDQELRGRRSSLLSGSASVPGVTVR